MKMFQRQPTKFEKNMCNYKGKKMVAFDNIQAKQMCTSWYFKRLDGFLEGNSLKGVDTWVFSVNDKEMKSCGEVDAEEILIHAFGSEDVKYRRFMLYKNITEIHHMMSDGTVRILSCDGKKLDEAIVLTHEECIERVRTLRTVS
jgi:hypothetical protein